jgi:integrase
MKRDLNDAWLRAVKPPTSGRLEVVDARTPGLVFRMTSAGAASWVFRGRTRDARSTRIKLGDYLPGAKDAGMSLGEARAAAKDAAADLRKGADPVAEKRAAKAARLAREAAEARARAEAEAMGGGPLPGSVAARLAEWQAARAAEWSPRYAAEVSRVAEKAIIPALGSRSLAETARADWTGLIAEWRRSVTKPKPAPKAGEKGRPGAPPRDGSGAAAFLYRTVSAFLNFAEVHGWIAAPLLPRKGAGLIAPAPAARARVLTDAELLAIWRAADREPPKLRAFVRLLILTGVRELEAADIAAGELDREAGRWTIPGERTKNGIGYTLPLSPLALAELGAVWPEEEPAADHKLLGRVKGSGFRGFGKLKMRMDAAAKVSGWRWHDLRRTARTGMTRLGVPRDHAEAAINHVSGRTKLERTYDRHDYAPEVIAALTRWQGHVAGLVGQAAEVVSLADRRRASSGK